MIVIVGSESDNDNDINKTLIITTRGVLTHSLEPEVHVEAALR